MRRNISIQLPSVSKKVIDIRYFALFVSVLSVGVLVLMAWRLNQL